MSKEEKNIRVVKINALGASGWAIDEGVINVEIPKPEWEALERTGKQHSMSMDFILAEAILELFREGKV